MPIGWHCPISLGKSMGPARLGKCSDSERNREIFGKS